MGISRKHAVLPGDAHALVGEEGDVHGAEAALLPRRVDPRQVAEVRVSRAGDQLAADLAEPGSGVAEGDDLGGADEGEVEGVEEEDDIFTTVVRQTDLLELTYERVGVPVAIVDPVVALPDHFQRL